MADKIWTESLSLPALHMGNEGKMVHGIAINRYIRRETNTGADAAPFVLFPIDQETWAFSLLSS